MSRFFDNIFWFLTAYIGLKIFFSILGAIAIVTIIAICSIDFSKPLTPIVIETKSNLDIRGNITPIIVKGYISKDNIYFNLFSFQTGNPIELPSWTGVVSINYIGGGAVGKMNSKNGFFVTHRAYRDGIIRTLRKEKNITLRIRTEFENGGTVLFNIPLTIDE